METPNYAPFTTSDTFMKPVTQLILLLYPLITLLLSANPIHAADIDPAYKPLVKRLQMDGIDEQYLQDIFSCPELKLMPKAVAMSLVRRESELNYAQFLEKDSVDRGVSYLKAHRSTLEKMESHFNISAPLVVAILCIESACGTYTGKFETVNILVTQALCLEPGIYQQIYDQIPSEERLNLTPQEIKEGLMKRRIRSYRELKALLAYARAHNIDPFSLTGSIEGAIGLPQFLPSNITRYGFDGDGDGQIDVFQHEDAIPSIASYLKAHKWEDNNNYRRKKKILLKYNHSGYYATTVLELAETLASYWHYL
jgi:membrane-bound lytic murein transglycosylase B